MAKVIENYTFRGREVHADYDWDNWLDGRVWELVAGEDFACKPSSIRLLALGAARRRKVGVRVSVNTKDGIVRLQAFALTEDDGETEEGNGQHTATTARERVEVDDSEDFKKLTIKKLKSLLDENTIPYPEDADKAVLIQAAIRAGL